MRYCGCRIGLDLLASAIARSTTSSFPVRPDLVDQLIPMDSPVGAFGEKLQNEFLDS
jgi:hypothetical protein